MTMHKGDMREDEVFRFDIEPTVDPREQALSNVSRRLIEDSEKLRQRSAELCNEMMRTQSD